MIARSLEVLVLVEMRMLEKYIETTIDTFGGISGNFFLYVRF